METERKGCEKREWSLRDTNIVTYKFKEHNWRRENTIKREKWEVFFIVRKVVKGCTFGS